MSSERFAEKYISMSERYADALAGLEALKGQIGVLVVGAALGAEELRISDPELGADTLTAAEILNRGLERQLTSREVIETYEANRDALRRIFENRGQFIWWEETIPDVRHHERIWRFNHNFLLGVIPEDVTLHGKSLHIPRVVHTNSREHEEFSEGSLPLDVIKAADNTPRAIARSGLAKLYALPEGKEEVLLPPERVLIGDGAVLDRMTELLTDPLLFEADSGYLNIEYPSLLKFLLQTGKMTDEMIASVSEFIAEQHALLSAEWEPAIESRNYWSDKVDRSTPQHSLRRILYEDANQDLDITCLHKYRWGRMSAVMNRHLAAVNSEASVLNTT